MNRAAAIKAVNELYASRYQSINGGVSWTVLMTQKFLEEVVDTVIKAYTEEK